MKKVLLGFMFVSIFLPTLQALAQSEVVPDKQEVVKAKVLEILDQNTGNVPGTDVQGNFQTIKVEILDGSEKGKVIDVENDYLNLKKGEIFYLRHITQSLDGSEYYTVDEPYRLPQLITLVIIFIIAVFFLGGIQGIRGLLSLAGSLLLILYVLLPGILHGYSPLLVATGVSSLIIIVGSYITHGVNKTTTSAVIGMIGTVIITGVLGYIAVHWTRLSGFGSEEVAYLNINARGSIDVVGLLLGGIMIGLLGVLYDVAISQAIAVEELSSIAPHVSPQKIYKRAIRIGREHIGALVNTLAIAYVGVSLPLLLLFTMSSNGNWGSIINREIFATEIVRTIIGSIGLILAVPVTTFVAVWMIMKKKNLPNIPSEMIEKENEILEQVDHSHIH